MQLRDILPKDVYCASPTSTVSEVAGLMLRHNIGEVPICEGDRRLVGIVTDRDLAIECCTADVDVQNVEIRQFMTHNPVTAGPDMDLKAACDLMGREQIRRLPIVEDGRLLGVISLGDLAVCMPQEQAALDALVRISTPSRVSPQVAAKTRRAA